MLPKKWNYEADVVVVGYGAAGAAVAITAHDTGATVLILEKQRADISTFLDHTPSVRMGASATATPTNAAQVAKYLELSQFGNIPRAICQVLAEELCQNKAWLEQIGARIVQSRDIQMGEMPMIPEASRFTHVMHYQSGPGLWQTLANAVEKVRTITVLWATPGKELVQNPETKEILGVVAEKEERKLYVKARRAVVLTTGGFEHNEELKGDFLGYPNRFYANPGSTGDGIKMAQGVGAALWHMSAVSGRPIPKTPLKPNPGGGYPHAGAFIYVDRFGRRFYDESMSTHHSQHTRSHVMVKEIIYYNAILHMYPRIPCYLIFDETTRLKGPIGSSGRRGLLPDGTLQYFYQWSKDNSAEIAKGWILKGKTIEELATTIKADPDNGGYMEPTTLKNTITTWNEYCTTGKDLEFDVDPKYLKPLKTPPYYAQPCLPGGPTTLGGPKRNAQSQVLDSHGKPLPRLYAAGEMGSPFVYLPGIGANLGEAFASGRIAGRNAAAEKPWG